MKRRFELTDEEWGRLAPLLPSTKPRRGDAGGTTARSSTASCSGSAPGALAGPPQRYGPWETVYKRFARWQTDGTWARIQAALHTQADGAGELDWDAQIDSTVVRATSTPPAPARGAPRDPGKPAAALGRSRGGLTTKLHTICDGRGRNLVTRLTQGRTPTPASWSGWSSRCGWPALVAVGGRAPGWRI